MSTEAPISVFDQWMADWMETHPPAGSIADMQNSFTTIEIMHAYFMSTMDEGVFQDAIQRHLLAAEYPFYDGGWLTL